MKVVIAIDSFKGSMTSLEAGESAAAGIRRVYPDADIRIRPLADGGEGTVDALTMGLRADGFRKSVSQARSVVLLTVYMEFWKKAGPPLSKCPLQPVLP